ncbi:hypothetical protein B0I37DRAFT_410081 [Chaetomium sp. MPI-CAGE-AT-0009]|nr:hypothetical protein B0I37DRAFT_410081 [Chaetomium sp. MPI-CAGE-AT-0009]
MSTSPSAPLHPSYYADRSWVPIVVVTSTLTIATTCVCLRTYTRAAIIRRFGPDDWAAGFYVSIVLYNASLTATKFTFLLQYHRIFGTGTVRTNIVIVVAIVIIALWSISQLMVAIFTCTPIPKFWHPEIPGTCIPSLPFWYFNAAGNIITDIIIFVLPMPALCRLNLRRGQKLGLIAVFSLGFFTCAISVIRIQYLKLSDDVTWDNVGAACWSIGEVCSGITCACLPTLRPFFASWLPALCTTQRGDHSDRGDHSRSSRSQKNKYYFFRQSSGRGDSRRPSHGGDASTRGVVMGLEDLELQPSGGRDDGFGKGVGARVNCVVEDAEAGRGDEERLWGRAEDGVGLGIIEPFGRSDIGVALSTPEPAWPLADRGVKE